jgi:hypothetical protein
MLTGLSFLQVSNSNSNSSSYSYSNANFGQSAPAPTLAGSFETRRQGVPR